MPAKPAQVCGRGPCMRRALQGKRFCAQHEQEVQTLAAQRTAKRDALLGNSTARGYGHEWRKAARAYLLENPICVECWKNRQAISATVVDHITPHNGDSVLFWDRSNWQSLCMRCHGHKTATTDRGFGNKGRGDQISTALPKRPRASAFLAQSLNSGGES